MLVRLQKIIADRGFCSRRKAEEFISDSKVKVDGHIVTELGQKYEEDTVEIEIAGTKIKPNNSKHKYYLVNKPIGFICTAQDDRGRKEVTRLIPPSEGRLFPVGRLDINTSGAIILTDDGDFANLVMHPSSSFEKTYEVVINGVLSSKEKVMLERGVMLDDGLTAPAKVTEFLITPERSTFEITIHEGRNRQVRRMVQAVNHDVIALRRTRIGPLKLGNLVLGGYVSIPSTTIESIKKTCRFNKSHNSYKKLAK